MSGSTVFPPLFLSSSVNRSYPNITFGMESKTVMMYLPDSYLKTNVLVLYESVQAMLVPECIIWF